MKTVIGILALFGLLALSTNAQAHGRGGFLAPARNFNHGHGNFHSNFNHGHVNFRSNFGGYSNFNYRYNERIILTPAFVNQYVPFATLLPAQAFFGYSGVSGVAPFQQPQVNVNQSTGGGGNGTNEALLRATQEQNELLKQALRQQSQQPMQRLP